MASTIDVNRAGNACASSPRRRRTAAGWAGRFALALALTTLVSAQWARADDSDSDDSPDTAAPAPKASPKAKPKAKAKPADEAGDDASGEADAATSKPKPGAQSGDKPQSAATDFVTLADPTAREGFIQPSPTVQKRIFTLDGKNDLAVFGAFSLNNILTEHDGGALSWAYNFGEYFAIEILAGGGIGQITNLVSELRNDNGALQHVSATDLSNAGALMAYGQGGVRLTPLYGKFNLASELPVHFDLYINAGAGVAMVQYNSVLGCVGTPVGMPLVCQGAFYQSAPTPTWAFNVGGGIRLFITQAITLRVEVHDMVFPDQYYSGLNLTTGFNNSSNKTIEKSGLTQVPLMLAGLGFLL